MSAKNQTFQSSLLEYRKLLEKGTIKEAYKGLMGYLEALRLYFEKKYPDFFVSGSIHYGLMDYSYFYFFPKAIKQQKLKIVILFVHDTFRFEAWLAGYNKSVQAKYWRLFKEGGFNKYHMPSTIQNVDSILEHVLVDNADFSSLDELTRQIEVGALKFIENVEGFLIKH